MALADDDGKYRPEATTKVPLILPVTTTLRPRWNDPRWSDPRWAGNPTWNNHNWNNNWNANRYNSTWNDWNRGAGNWGNEWAKRYNVDGDYPKLCSKLPNNHFLFQFKDDQSQDIQTGVQSV